MYLNEYEIEKITRLATEVATKTYYELAKQENAQQVVNFDTTRSSY